MGRPKTVGLRKINLTIATAGVAVPISATTLNATDFEVYVNAANTGTNCYVGDSTVDNTWIPRGKGTITNFVHGAGNFLGPRPVLGYDLSKIYIDADANGDEVVIQYFAGEQ